MRNLTLILIISLIISSCRNGNNNQMEITNNSITTIETITTKKVMNVGYLEFPPCVIKDKTTGKLTGIFVDMVNQMALSLDPNMKVNWVETSLANFTADLKTNKFDFSVGPTFVNIPRSTAVNFTSPICYVGNCSTARTSNGNIL